MSNSNSDPAWHSLGGETPDAKPPAADPTRTETGTLTHEQLDALASWAVIVWRRLQDERAKEHLGGEP